MVSIRSSLDKINVEELLTTTYRKVHEIGNKHKTLMPNGNAADAVNVIVVRDTSGDGTICYQY